MGSLLSIPAIESTWNIFGIQNKEQCFLVQTLHGQGSGIYDLGFHESLNICPSHPSIKKTPSLGPKCIV